MCRTCIEETGFEIVWKSQFKRGISLVSELYEITVTGGPLHVELDDYNLDGEYISVLDSIEWYEENKQVFLEQGYYDEENWDRMIRLSHEIAGFLSALTEQERYSFMAYYDYPNVYVSPE